MAVKKRDHENLTDSNIAHVIALLEAEKPITKKEACEILNISYNTARLGKILDSWKERKAHETRMRNKNRGKAATESEIKSILLDYLQGDGVSEIAKSLYRSTTFVNNIVERVGVPKRASGDDKFKTSYLPEECVSDEFDVGDVVWSAVHHSPCTIIRELSGEVYKEKYNTRCYQVYIPERVNEPSPYFPQVEWGGQNAYLPSYELGKLTHLEKYGVDTSKI